MSDLPIPYYEVAAFTAVPFAGNPAGVCLLEEWLPDSQLQSIATENNLSETAFVVGSGVHYELRWFTPTCEVELCGHATLASAHVLFHHVRISGPQILFETKTGTLSVSLAATCLMLDFPSQPPTCSDLPADQLCDALGATPELIFRDRDYLAVFDSENAIRALRPDFPKVEALQSAVIVTAPGNDCDFVSRYFAPNFGIPEDPVTGSIHCSLIPYWSKRLRKSELYARQVSPRGGRLFCEDRGDRVGIGGNAVTYLVGKIYVPRSPRLERPRGTN